MRKANLFIALALGAFTVVWALAAPIEMGRLFFSPQERQVLDRGGRLRSAQNEPVASETTASSAPVAPGNVQLQGYVAKPGGDTVWINGESVRVGQTNQEGISPQKSQQLPRVPVKMKNGRVVELNVGEEFDPNTQTVERINVKKH